MTHRFEVFKWNFSFFLNVFSILLSIGAISYFGWLSIKLQTPLLIAIDQNGSRIVSHSDDPIYKTEVVTFITQFLNSLYNFDPKSFDTEVGRATSLMSDQLWKKKKSSLLDLKGKVLRAEITHSGIISKISKVSTFDYQALIFAKEVSRLSNIDREIKVSFSIGTVKRDQNNPFGLEVTKYEEMVTN